jgi:flagellar L-ring protein precursor FlgH
MPVNVEQAGGERAEGSLWTDGERVNYLYADQRALRAGDILTVQVEEFADAKRETSTSKKRVTEMNADITAFLGLMAKLNEADSDIDPKALLDASSKINFDAEAGTGRSERLTATVPVMVKKVLPNGNLFVEGHRVILVNNEEHHFYVSGVARPYDIDESNSVASSRLADAEIEFTGRGVLSEGQKPGPVARFFGWIWPF